MDLTGPLTAGPGDITRGAPGRIGDPPPVLTWRYHRGDPDGTLRVVRAHGCDITPGRITWRDWHGGIVLSEPSELVHHLALEQADGTADDRPAYADESIPCSWCIEADHRGHHHLDMTGHAVGCPHAPRGKG